MRHHPFGPGERPVPVIGQGTWDIDEGDRALAIAAQRRGLDLGMTHIDTAEIYGDAEPHHDLPPALRPRCGAPGQGREEGPRPRRHARHQGRRGRLPFPVDPDLVQASFENGVLTVTVPKTGQQERSRRIQVQGRSSGGQASQGGQGASGGTGDGGSRGGQGGAPDSTPGGASS